MEGMKKIENAVEMNESLFEYYYAKRPTQKQFCKIFGKEIALPRSSLNYGKSYVFNGGVQSCCEMDDYMNHIIDIIVERFNIEKRPNSCLVNWYANGDEYIGYHKDNENSLEHQPLFICSFGEERVLKFKHTGTGEVHDFSLPHGSLLKFPYEINDNYKHSIPKSKKITKPRISFSFRYIK